MTGLDRVAGWVARSVGSAVHEGEDLFRGIWGDDDPDGEDLEPLVDTDDPELDELDDPFGGDATTMVGRDPDQARLPRLLSKLDPAPDFPLAEPFTAGLGPLLGRWIDAEPDGVLADGRTRRVLDLIGSRFTVTVSDEAISITGLVRSRNTKWDRVQEVVLEDRYTVFTDRVVAGSVSLLLGRRLLPIPGLGWLLRGVIGLVESMIPDGWRASMQHESGRAFASIRRSMARDVELAGPLALVAFLSEGLTATIAHLAEERNVLTRR
ncbi:hypothetical protein [Ilumatobacter nonamiensis]|uniref:hypothetical protein n=1 Tax=Ilumatobacter nonamiensis TaxID=467093 RepID=UPI00058BC070|nr:hypothetical protein [Ilumatobacter nonamiensis]